jgi:hypothetical protein
VGELAALGVDVEVFEDGDPAAAASGRWLVFRGSAGWYPRSLRALASLSGDDRPRTLLWVTEPLPPPAGSGFATSRRNVRDLAKLALRDPRANDQRTNLARVLAFARVAPDGVLAVSTAAKVETLGSLGIDAAFVPYGGSAPRPGDPTVRRDIDVLFLGDPAVPHRRRALRQLRREGVDVVARGAWDAKRGLWGTEREGILRRTKLLLNISRHPGNAADSRLGLGASFGAVTVSEPMYRPDPWIAGEHFVEGPLDEMPGLITDLLADEPRRERIAVAAAEIARRYTLAHSARMLVDLIDGVRSSSFQPPPAPEGADE